MEEKDGGCHGSVEENLAILCRGRKSRYIVWGQRIFQRASQKIATVVVGDCQSIG